jgi:hypothetical protein
MSYTEISGSVISLTKSQIFGWNIMPREMLDISRVMGMEGCTNWDALNTWESQFSKPSQRLLIGTC